jgi:hypothetical protein
VVTTDELADWFRAFAPERMTAAIRLNHRGVNTHARLPRLCLLGHRSG